MSNQSRGAAFTLPAAVRVVRGVQRVERSYYNARSYRGRYPVAPQAQVLYLGADAGSGAAAGGTGDATVTINGSPQTVSYTNPYAHSSVPAKVVMWLAKIQGTYYAVAWDCA